MEVRLIGLVLIVLLIGLGIGYGLGYVVYQLQIHNLQGEIQNLQGELNRLNSRSWHHIDTFVGIYDRTTETFTIEGDLWRVRWFAEAEHPEFAFFALLIYPEGESAPFIESVDCYSEDFEVCDIQTGVEYIIGRGNYYIKVLAANIKGWTIHVESYH